MPFTHLPLEAEDVAYLIGALDEALARLGFITMTYGLDHEDKRARAALKRIRRTLKKLAVKPDRTDV